MQHSVFFVVVVFVLNEQFSSEPQKGLGGEKTSGWEENIYIFSCFSAYEN